MRTKNIKIFIAFAAVIILGIFAFTFFKSKNEYRSIKVYEINGSAVVIRENQEQEAYENMALFSGDRIIMSKGNMTLKLDDDKYIRVEEATELELESSGNSNVSRTVINLVKGRITNDIENKLSDDSVYEIHAQNSSMGVRGTTFYVTADDQSNTAKVVVFEGAVAVGNKANENIEIKNEDKLIDKGFQMDINNIDTENSDYIKNDIIYEELPKTAILFAIDRVETDTSEDIIEKATQAGAITEEDLLNREALLKSIDDVNSKANDDANESELKQCPECEGTGIFNCDTCNNTGFMTCSICGGTGLDTEECGWCNGNGICNMCNGSGVYNRAGEEGNIEEVCELCIGSGVCASCDGKGYNPCHRCNNRDQENHEHVGFENCQDCGGHSGEVCFMCGGSGKVKP